MKKVLITLDYSPAAQIVAETGYSIAQKMDASICIVHVITDAAWYAMDYSPIMGYQGGYTSGTNEVLADIKQEAENFLNATAKHLGGSNITTKVLEGETTDAIIEYSKEWNADLIVMGSHSHHGLDRIFGTDVATYILKHAQIPVLAIPTAGDK
ncbi:MAG: universal stress protein [Bacteroidetes bacterium]|nr:universal stress protein [Bacteroidota bacterium]